MLRIISGKYRGRQIEQPPLEITRPTSDRAKEAIFSSIQFQIEGSVILDLFSGSGAYSLESSSRGAMKTIAVENNPMALKVIKNNIEKLHITNIDVINSDVLIYLNRMTGIKFDFIFMDPPYDNIEIYNNTLDLLRKANALKETGVIICETSNPSKISIPEGLVIQKDKKYGKAHVLTIANNI